MKNTRTNRQSKSTVKSAPKSDWNPEAAHDLIQALRAQAGRKFTKVPTDRYRKIRETFLDSASKGLNSTAYAYLKNAASKGQLFTKRAMSEIFQLAKAARQTS
jgi:5,10-methenyltetrahydromethanopterin hydrogenase